MQESIWWTNIYQIWISILEIEGMKKSLLFLCKKCSKYIKNRFFLSEITCFKKDFIKVLTKNTDSTILDTSKVLSKITKKNKEDVV